MECGLVNYLSFAQRFGLVNYNIVLVRVSL
jgi:hypothetical protein